MRLNVASAAACPDTTTYEGAPAFTLSPKDKLATLVATCLLGEATFYESGDTRRARLDALVAKVGDDEFVAKLAVYARTTWNLRTVSVYLVLSLARAIRDGNREGARSSALLRCVTCDVIQRADEVRELLAGALTVFGDKKKVPQAIKRGLGDALRKFGQYAIAKYAGGSGAVSFKDVLRMVHPVPAAPEQSALWQSVMDGTLTMPEGSDTWERIISAKGSTTEAWREAAGVMPYMALLRNLRNLAQHDAITPDVLARIADPEAVAKSRQLPMRYLSAARELEKAGCPSGVVAAVMDASEHSLVNLPLLGQRVLVVVDVSGSMHDARVSAKSSVSCADVACMMGASLALATLRSGGEAVLVPFASHADILPVVPRDLLLRVAEGLIHVSNQLGGSTEIGSAWTAATQAGGLFDAIVVFSDMQVMDDDAASLAPQAPLRVSFDLAGYGKTPFVQRRGWHLLAGWSDQALAALSVLRQSKGLASIVEAA